MERPKVKGVIRNRIRKAFETYFVDCDVTAFAKQLLMLVTFQ